MPLPALMLPILIAAAPPSPVVVTGHFWAPFISPMGEPFRARAAGEDTLAKWFYQADRNRDGMLTPDEMQADAERFFAILDTDHDGEIGPDELVAYEWDVAPDIQVMSRTRPAPGETPEKSKHRPREDYGPDRKARFESGNGHGFQGAARYSLLNMPEPVAAADANFDRGISLAEFRQAAIERFGLLDSERHGRLALLQLEALLPGARTAGRHVRERKDALDTRIAIPVPQDD
jgi:hypothetical protein